jgi:FlaA1/EpsC-like NDP-sugar epimerase
VAFVDDDPAKVGTHIQGLPVLGTCAQVPELVDRYQIQRIVVAMPSVPLERLREIVAICEKTGVATHSLPGIYELLAGYKTISRLPQVDINRLLHREPVEIDQTKVAAALSGTTVLVTGAGGSIGSELCRQIARFDPAQLILLGHGENSIFEIGLDLRLSFPELIAQPVIVDVRDQGRVNSVVKRYRPDVIFHAAAHKHVPFMEANVKEAITNNVLGTQSVLRAAEQYGVERFILISTDKAVNPTSIMGATKRLAELLVVAAAQRSGRAYMAVRFGNVLGSRGSVIPVFQRQIAAGGPLTVTHPDMCRYFMTIPEAAQLVLQASALGQGGETFVLDMGEPVRILDLVTDLIKLSGLEPGRDIKIVYTGIRPGEKLSEELFLEREVCRRTECPKIFVANGGSDDIEAVMLERLVIELVNLVKRMQSQNAVERVRLLLPEVCRYIDNYQSRPQPLLPEPTVLDHQPALVEPRLGRRPPMVKPASA